MLIKTTIIFTYIYIYIYIYLHVLFHKKKRLRRPDIRKMSSKKKKTGYCNKHMLTYVDKTLLINIIVFGLRESSYKTSTFILLN